MDETRVFRLIDPNRRAYRWYKLALISDAGDLFHHSKVSIQRGRIGEEDEVIDRYFESHDDAKRFFERKASDRVKHGYAQVDALEPLSDPQCALCRLLSQSDKDYSFVYEFRHSMLFLNWDQSYPGRSMLVIKKHLPDFFRLGASELLGSFSEIRRSEEAIRKAFSAKMMNYLFMGNRAGHVHLHLVPRYESDPNFGNSPFLDTRRTEHPQLPEDRYRDLAAQIRKHLDRRRFGAP